MVKFFGSYKWDDLESQINDYILRFTNTRFKMHYQAIQPGEMYDDIYYTVMVEMDGGYR